MFQQHLRCNDNNNINKNDTLLTNLGFFLHITISAQNISDQTQQRQLKASINRERKILASLSDVKAQLVDNAERLQLALKARKHDNSVIKTLRSELEQALQQANSSKSREAHAMELVAQLRREVKSLTKYAHRAFSEGRLAARRDQHQLGRQMVGGSGLESGEEVGKERLLDQRPIELMPDFATWKRQHNHSHDHSRRKAALPSPSIPTRSIHLRSPMERAVQRGQSKLKFRK